MADMAHTPGPWTLTQRTCSIGCCDDIHEVAGQYPEDAEPCRHIATVNGGNAVWLHEGESEANARLIAAAPDMLALLEELEWNVTEEYFGNQFCPVCDGCKDTRGHAADCKLAELLKRLK